MQNKWTWTDRLKITDKWAMNANITNRVINDPEAYNFIMTCLMTYMLNHKYVSPGARMMRYMVPNELTERIGSDILIMSNKAGDISICEDTIFPEPIEAEAIKTA